MPDEIVETQEIALAVAEEKPCNASASKPTDSVIPTPSLLRLASLGLINALRHASIPRIVGALLGNSRDLHAQIAMLEERITDLRDDLERERKEARELIQLERAAFAEERRVFNDRLFQKNGLDPAYSTIPNNQTVTTRRVNDAYEDWEEADREAHDLELVERGIHDPAFRAHLMRISASVPEASKILAEVQRRMPQPDEETE